MTRFAQAPSLLQRRRTWLTLSFGAITLAVMGLAAQRLLMPLAPVHFKVDGKGQILTRTQNPYRGAAGTLFAGGSPLALNPADALNDRHRAMPTQGLMRDLVVSETLAQALEPALNAGLTDFSKHRMAQGNTPLGRQLELTLSAPLQHSMQAASECFTGQTQRCKTALPPHLLAADPRFVDAASGIRAGMAAYLVVKEDSGAILAMGGSVSDCVADKLRRRAIKTSAGARPVFASTGDVCSQFPDAKHADWMGLSLKPGDYERLAPGEALDAEAGMALDPSHWPLDPGSTAKKELAIACVRAGLLHEPDELARLQFARSADNDFFKALALRCVDTYRDVYAHYAQDLQLLHPAELLKGGGYPGWSAAAVPAQLPAGPTLEAAKYLALDGSAARTDRRRLRLDAAQFQMLDTSRTLATIAIGNGGHRSTLAHHANSLRLLGLASQGQRQAAVMHLARDRDTPLPQTRNDWMPDRQGTLRVLHLLGGVTGTQGTARAACQRVVAPCPAEGLDDLAGKTGTSDIAYPKRPDFVKTGFPDAMPSKLFVARFRVAGAWYVVATQALRSRDPVTRRLDDSNAAAELGLLVRHQLLAEEKS